MGRVRGVGKQAAADGDFVQLGLMNARFNALPGEYLTLNRLNQPLGVPQLDSNNRMENIYLPSDISRTTLEASGTLKSGGKLTVGGNAEVAGSTELKGALTALSLALGTPTTPGGAISGATTIAASGAITGASATVTGAVKAATADIPEITSATLKAKALTVDSINNPGGGLTLSGLVSQGSIAAVLDSTANRDVKAGRDVVALNNVSAAETISGKSAVLSQNLQANTLTTTGTATLDNATVNNSMVVSGGLTLGGGLAAVGREDVIGWLDSRITALEGGDALVNWIVPTLNTGVTSSSLDPFMYRVVTDNGRRKVQMRGRLNLSSAITSLFTMPAGTRPVYDLAPILLGREFGGGAVAIIMDVKASGLINLAAHTTGAKSGAITSDSGGSGTTGASNVSFNHGHKFLNTTDSSPSGSGWGSPDSYRNSDWGVKDFNSGSHTHSTPAHTHGVTIPPVTYATFVGFTGVEYFL